MDLTKYLRHWPTTRLICISRLAKNASGIFLGQLRHHVERGRTERPGTDRDPRARNGTERPTLLIGFDLNNWNQPPVASTLSSVYHGWCISKVWIAQKLNRNNMTMEIRKLKDPFLKHHYESQVYIWTWFSLKFDAVSMFSMAKSHHFWPCLLPQRGGAARQDHFAHPGLTELLGFLMMLMFPPPNHSFNSDLPWNKPSVLEIPRSGNLHLCLWMSSMCLGHFVLMIGSGRMSDNDVVYI